MCVCVGGGGGGDNFFKAYHEQAQMYITCRGCRYIDTAIHQAKKRGGGYLNSGLKYFVKSLNVTKATSSMSSRLSQFNFPSIVARIYTYINIHTPTLILLHTYTHKYIYIYIYI